MRWQPQPLPDDSKDVDFIQGLHTFGGSGAPDIKCGFAIHMYLSNKSMINKAFCNADGDFLIVPQYGTLLIHTECGLLRVAPTEICVIQRGHTFSVDLDGPSRGYICEVFNGHFRLPDLGPIGSNGLANPRDFKYPTAHFENRKCNFTVIQKFLGELFAYTKEESPFNVVGWVGNYVPYKYDLNDFVPVNSVLKDHMDPSIFTVLTCPTTEPGVAACDFVIFPPRWLAAENTFRPPWYHRNCMTEFMGNIQGSYDAREGFLPGGASLHSCMSSHGPDGETYNKAINKDTTKPDKIPEGALQFMFESTYIMRLTDWGQSSQVEKDYWKCWQGCKNTFQSNNDNNNME